MKRLIGQIGLGLPVRGLAFLREALRAGAREIDRTFVLLAAAPIIAQRQQEPTTEQGCQSAA